MLLLVREGVNKGHFKRSCCKEVLNLCFTSTWILLRNTVPNSCTKSKENECFNWCVMEYLMLRLPLSENLVLSLCTCVRWKKKRLEMFPGKEFLETSCIIMQTDLQYWKFSGRILYCLNDEIAWDLYGAKWI